MKTALSRRTVAALTLVGVWAAFFARQIFSDGIPFRRDTLLLYLPIRNFIHESLKSGRLPRWFPYEGIGVPFIGQLVTATFHPLTWLLLPLDPAYALKANILLAYLIALSGGYNFARRLGASRPGAMCGAFSLAFCGYAVSMSDNLPYLMGLATLPWVGVAAAGVARRRNGRSAAFLAMPMGLLILCGDVQAFVCGPLVIVATIMATERSRRALAWCAFGCALGAGLSAIELAPATAVYADSARLTSGFIFDVGSFWALHPMRLLALVVPNFLPLGYHQATSELLFGQKFRWAATIFAGSLSLAFVLGSGRVRRIALPFGVVTLLSWWLALGSHAGATSVLKVVSPALATFRFPEKFIALFQVAIVPLVAIGADATLSNPLRNGRPIGMAAFSALIGALALVLVFGDSNLAVAWSLGLAVTGMFLLAVSAVLLVPALRIPSTILVPAFVACELWWSNSPYLPVVPRATLAVESSAFGPALVPRRDEPPRRIVSQAKTRYDTNNDGPSDETWVRTQMEMLRPDVAGLFHASTIGVSEMPSQSQRTRDVFGPLGARTSALGPLFGACGQLADTDPAFLHAIASDSSTQLELVPVSCRASAYFATTTRAPAEIADALESIKPNEAFWEGPAITFPRDAQVEWNHYLPGEFGLSAGSSDSAGLIVSEGFAPGWSASIDGVATPIHPANGIAMGVEVPSGKHIINFVYSVPRFALGIAISIASVLACLLLIAFSRNSRSPTPNG